MIPAAHPARSVIPHHHHGELQSGTALTAVQSLLYLIVVALFIISFTTQPFRIPSGSMESTLLVGDFLLVNKQLPIAASAHGILPAPGIRHGDIIVFHYPVEPSLHLVKRVIGLPGDRIKLRDGRVYRNSQLLTEPYAIYRSSPPDSFRDNFPRTQSAEPGINSRWWIQMHRLTDHGELIVPSGHYFVLGDNRNNSDDSRYWGFVPQQAIVGTPFVVYFSLRQSDSGDPPATAQLRTPFRRSAPTLFDRLADAARWTRILQIIH